MTPIRGFFKRLLGTPEQESSLQPAQTRERSRRQPSDAAPDPDAPRRRRRGRRGGRGRNRSAEGEAQPASGTEARPERPPTREPARKRNEPRAERAGRNGAAAQKSERSYAWGRKVDDDEARKRIDEAARRRRGGGLRFRANLDAPLPEDVAFRPRDEGGDTSILPSRRRRPEGLRDTERVIIAGPRSLGGWIRRPVEPPAPPDEPDADLRIRRVEDAPPEEEPLAAVSEAVRETEEAEPRPRRRRGRRGGRGRRRGDREEDGAADASAATLDRVDTPQDIEDAEPDETEPDDIEPEAAPPPRIERRGRRQAEPAPRSLPALDATGDLPEAFAELGASERSLVALARFGFSDPTPIQVQAIPTLLAGRDVVGVAQTGSGKTVAFGVPMVERLDAAVPEVQGLVLVPTRELAQQVLDVLRDLGEPWGLEAVGLLGGHSLRGDFQALERRPHVVVGTPGRILDHLKRGTLSLRHVTYAVLDEADQMLDIGFLPDIRRILSRTPQRRQTALFSATMPTSIKRLIWQFMDDPETVRVDPELATVETVTQVYFEVAERDKVKGLRELIERELKGRTLVFCRMKRGVDRLARMLSDDGVRVGTLHGDMEQRKRDSVVRDFREGRLDILIATNVAARGLDIPEITHVVNFDVPGNPEEYVHRIGRTGRAGRSGKAITFVGEWDIETFDAIRKEFGEQLAREELALYAPAAREA